MQKRAATTLINKARHGDIGAFTALVQQHQGMAFAYAYSILGDFHAAEDAAQDAFLCVYTCLPTLQCPEAFPGWLRGIVRHQCHRFLRSQAPPCASLECAAEVAIQTMGPEAQWEQQETREQVLAAVRALPSAQREVTTLYYIQDHPISQIAAFLDVPVTTVKNRLQQARTTLRRRMLPMVKETLQARALPQEFAQRVGQIVEVRGTLVDADFKPDEVPALLTGLTVARPGGEPIVVEVVQHLGAGRVRGVALLPLQSLLCGMEVVSVGMPITQPLSPEEIAQVMATVRGSSAQAGSGETPRLLETGIKAIDLLCPFTEGGSVGFFGDMGAGKAVLVGEILHNLAEESSPLTLFAFVDSQDEAALLAHTSGGLPHSTNTAQALFLPTDDSTDALLKAKVGVLDCVLSLSKTMTARGLYPGIDPALSTSRLLDPAIVGQEHVGVAGRVRHLLEQAQVLSERADNLTDAEKMTRARARRVELFLTQPFFSAEPFTQRPGVRVPLADTLHGFTGLLAGEYDLLPEEAFSMSGGIADVIAKVLVLSQS